MLRFRNKPLRDQLQYGTFTPGTPLVDPDAAVHSLLQAFPHASPTFLRWAVAHHLACKPPPDNLDIIVDAVSEKILDGLGTLYPRKGRGPDTEEGEIWRINQDLQTLCLVYPFHPLAYLRSLLTSKPMVPAPLYLTSYLIASPPNRPETPLPRLLPRPRPTHYVLSKDEQVRSASYKRATARLLQSLFPTIAPSSIAALMAEVNHSYARSKDACETMVRARGMGARVWGGLSASLRGIVSRGSLSGSTAKKGTGVGKEKTTEKWERCEELVREVWEEGKEKREEVVERDEEIAREINRVEYEKKGQLVECCCCFGEEPWEEMGACGEGHLVCSSCINTHVSVLLPTIAFPPITFGTSLTSKDVAFLNQPPADPSWTTSNLGTLVLCPSSCSSSLPYLTLLTHLTPSNLKSYNITIDSALSRALATNCSPLASAEEVQKCPFCPYTVLLPPSFPLLLASLTSWTTLTPYFAVLRWVLFFALCFSTEKPLHRWTASRMKLHELVSEVRLTQGGSILRCGRIDDCGRDSCLGCGGEVWGGVACGCGGAEGRKEEGVEGGEAKSEDKKKEDCRLYVEKAMSEALIRTCPRCELSFTKSEACNKMTCPRDGYKMCYVCRADLSEEGYSHFCQHFRFPPIGYCDKCQKCDLNLSPDDDANVQAAGARARIEWERLQAAPGGARGGREAGVEWARNMRVGPRSDREERMDRLTLSLTTLARSSLGTVALLSVDPTQELSVFLLSIRQLFQLVGKFCLAVGSS